MAHPSTYSAPARRQDPCEPESCCACPACGGLECLCRPRFFAGQLLTDEDLNRLDRYILDKNRLHNRHLHGWGVVCGLEVLCHPCKNQVLVKSGYALSPCGDDIIVCRDDPVDICQLIHTCKLKDRQAWDCDPPRPAHGDPCQEITEKWILAVCYDEKSTRGVTPLRGASARPCCSACDCGGHPGCHCSCHENGNGSSQPVPKKPVKPPPPQCEPTVVCETYKYIVYRAAEEDNKTHAGLRGPLVERFVCCVRDLIKSIPQPVPTSGSTPLEWFEYFCRLKQNLLILLSKRPTTSCEWQQRLQAIFCPAPDDPTFAVKMPQSNARLTAFFFDYILHCFCSALLPPCPEPVCDNCVPLAEIAVTAGDCRILHICNWTTHRRIVPTVPNLSYWLSPLPHISFLRRWLECVCCDGSRWLSAALGDTGAPVLPTTLMAYLLRICSNLQNSFQYTWNLNSIFGKALQKSNQPLDFLAMLRGLTGAKDEQTGKPILEPTERDNLFHFFTSNFLGAPLLRALAPGWDAAGGTKPAGSGGSHDFGALWMEMDLLRAEILEQRHTISELQQRLGDHP